MSWREREYKAMSDEALAARFRTEDDELAYEELIRRQKRRIFLDCYAFWRNASDAEEMTQVTFMKAFEARGRFDDKSYLAWLRQIARNACIDDWRKRRRAGPAVSIDGTDGDTPGREIRDTGKHPDVQLQVDEMYKEMAMLPMLQRKCLELQLEGHSYGEIAAKLKVPGEAVRSHLQNGMRTLRARMQKKKELA